MTNKKKKHKKKFKPIKKSTKKKTKSKKKKNSSEEELIIKVPKFWAKKAYANKNNYQKNTITQLKKMKNFGEKKEKG
jgi:hypothetical protein